MALAVIPARGGSKRIPRKNVRLFEGKPIIAWSIQAALDSGCFDHVIVSTDDEDIARIAREHGAEIPFMRPAGLSDDMTGTMPVIHHAIEEVSRLDQKPDHVCCLYPTAPFLSGDVLSDSFSRLVETGCDYVFSCTSYPYPVQRALKIAPDGHVEMIHPEHRTTRSQDLEEAYHDAGQFYWGRSEAFLENRPVFGSRSCPWVLPRHQVYDIDTEEDWVWAELAFRILKEQSRDPVSV